MSHLTTPLTVGTLELGTRLVMPPMATAKADADGRVTEALLAYYDEKSRGGAIGLVITEHCYVARQGMNRLGQPSVADDEAVEGLTQLAALIHRNGCKAAVQINHCGAASDPAATGLDVVAPSAVQLPGRPGALPRALTRADIGHIAQAFADAARRVQAAGFDAVEIHAAHGYLLSQFLSPLTNQRADEYGGDIHGRIRAHLEVIAAVRGAVGDAFPVLLRLGACDYLDGGVSIEDGVAAAGAFERAGVDMLDITGGLRGYVRPGHDEPGFFAELSEAIKKVVSLPVILTGGVTQAQQAEVLLDDGKADLIGVGRAILKDSEWAVRAVRLLEDSAS